MRFHRGRELRVRLFLLRTVAIGFMALFGGAGVSASAETPAPNVAGQQPAPNAAEIVTIRGWRSAEFGMTMDQVKQAIRRDFPASLDKAVSEQNAVEGTTSLSIGVVDLLPESGKSKVVYIFGYKTKKLIQINIIWGGQDSGKIKPQMAIDLANQLRIYLISQRYKPEGLISNATLPDGSIMVFRGVDAAAHQTMLLLAGVKLENGEAKEIPKVSVLLRLSYIMDGEHPDIYTIPQGQF
ncbi:Secretin_N domain-containing protein [Azospirillaceae bacterium]